MASGPKTGHKPENRGGARAGAGRKHQSVSDMLVNRMIVAAKKRAKAHLDATGKPREIHDVLLDIIYDNDENTKNRVAAIKLWHSAVLVKRTEKDINVNADGTHSTGIVELPAINEDPALKLVEGGKK